MVLMWIGIDGGGSNLRVVIVDDAMQIINTYHGLSVNPNTVGHDVAKDRIQQGIRSILEAAKLTTDQIKGLGIGIAGASARHSSEWLLQVTRPILPTALIIPSSDEEIGLVGARGKLEGVFLIAGTGSSAYGVHPEGKIFRAGGWGYLLGDEGAGYWIGNQALRAVTLYGDHRMGKYSALPALVLAHIGLNSPDEIIRWTYDNFAPARIAQLAQVVVAHPDDPYCQAIITQAGDHLHSLGQHILNQLDLSCDQIAFGGSLLTTQNSLSAYVVSRFGLSDIPSTLHAPVVGAALLAKIKYHAHRTT